MSPICLIRRVINKIRPRLLRGANVQVSMMMWMLGSTIPSFKRKRERESILYWAKNVLKNHVSYHISVIIIIGRLQMFTHYVQPKKYSLTRQHCEYKVMRRLRVSGEKVGGGRHNWTYTLGGTLFRQHRHFSRTITPLIRTAVCMWRRRELRFTFPSNIYYIRFEASRRSCSRSLAPRHLINSATWLGAAVRLS